MVKPIPEGFHTLTPQLSLENCAEAIAFFEKAFGAKEIMRAPDPSGKKVWHCDLLIGDSHVFVNDVFPGMGGPRPGSLWVYTENVEAAWKRAVEAGCEVVMPLSDMFWGDRFGKLKDRWGNEWGLAQHVKDPTPADMAEAMKAYK